MQEFRISSKNSQTILALGAESAGNFSVFQNETVYFSQDFGDLLKDINYRKFTNELNEFLKKNKIQPDVILSDLHPLFRTTELAKKLAEKYNAKYMSVQHHLAHIFSSVGDRMIHDTCYMIHDTCIGIACDGTGYGLDDKIWGGEIFRLKAKSDNLEAERIGHLENQIMLGGELAIKEPARMLIAILSKFLPKDEIYTHIKKYYTQNEFEVLFSQLQQKFNCLETSSTARVLDAVSLLLGFCKNESKFKHEPVELLEKNSTKPYAIKPVVDFDKQEKMFTLRTTPLLKYLLKNIHKDKSRLAATAQAYLANGFFEIKKEFIHDTKYMIHDTFFSGGMANNKIMSEIMQSRGAYVNKKIYPVKFPRSGTGKAVFNGVPRGDAGISFGQIIYYLLANPRD